MAKLVGVVFKHSDGTYGICGVDLGVNDGMVVDAILSKHTNDGSSIRGKLEELSLSEVIQ